MGTPILLFNDDCTRLIARGSISALHGEYDDINISRTRCLIEVTEVVVPAAIIKTHHHTSLSTFGTTPFKLSTALNPTMCGIGEIQEPESSGFGDLIRAELGSAIAVNSNARGNLEVDEESQREGEKILANTPDWNTVIRSRVIKDAFHIFNLFYISVGHGLRVEFARTLRDTLFIPDLEDKARLVSWGQRQNPPESWNDMVTYKWRVRVSIELKKAQTTAQKIDIVAMRRKLSCGIARFRTLQATYTPSALQALARSPPDPNKTPECTLLMLPLALTPEEREKGCVGRVSYTEALARDAQCEAALMRIRQQLHVKSRFMVYKKNHARAQTANT
ncbi:hypothetical protein C8F04DRAFT_1253813 [Mycena alexandri]|uniref:Uncharacterized protein n=1 Tax=Mycena alexandri TaxID=1745969 RepID=A0AAD6TAY5_9AGAR|nr:hypothetical protein C8F04DRAFT_1253813 [Mycena alexandri]